MATITFKGIGRDKKTWQAKITNPNADDIYKQLKKALYSADIEWFETGKDVWQVTAGMRPVGTFIVENND